MTLSLWILIASGWSLISLFLLRKQFYIRTKKTSISTHALTPQNTFPSLTLTVFKPTPSLPNKIIPPSWHSALESFLPQISLSSELLLGISTTDLPTWQPLLDRWKNLYPHATIRVISQSPEPSFPNPKIAWNKTLARHAQGKLWLWSDLDITVPPHYIETILHEYHQTPTAFITNAYRVINLHNRFGIFDALFVNAEFLPGVLLLNRYGKLKTAFGAGILFSPSILTDDKNWHHLGHSLADDFELAQLLGQGTLSSLILETSPQENSLLDSILHYLRWHKTIRWCDPIGYSGLLITLPLIGAISFSILNPSLLPLIGFISLLESFFGFLILRTTLKNLSPYHLPFLLLYPWTRVYAWIHSWLPTSVQWGKQKWPQPKYVRSQCKIWV